MIKKIVIILIIIISYRQAIVLAESEPSIYLQTDKQQYEKEELITITVHQQNLSIAAFDLQLVFDADKLEYVEGEETTNVMNNQLYYMWFDETGGQRKQTQEILATFVFRAKEEGIANIALQGEYYDAEGELLKAKEIGIAITIGQEETVNEEEKEETGESEDPHTSLLKTLRINEEGLSPNFSPDITEYYFVAEENIQNLEVTAIPENKEETVHITGNKNLKEGLNTITIEVLSENHENKTEYQIHVTKTSKIEEANTNLETLAIENQMLYPAFDNNTTFYQVQVENTVEEVRILAVPEDIEATVAIQGEKLAGNIPEKTIPLEEGDNLVTIEVTAQDKITKKEIQIQVHKNNEEEQKIYEEEQEEQQKIREELLKETASMAHNDSEQDQNIARTINEEEQTQNIEKEEEKQGMQMIWISIALGLLVILVISVWIFHKK